MTIKHIINHGIHVNATKFVERGLCDERSGNMAKSLGGIEEKIDRVLEKHCPPAS